MKLQFSNEGGVIVSLTIIYLHIYDIRSDIKIIGIIIINIMVKEV